jgi:LysR family cys regulon transcriptional activator
LESTVKLQQLRYLVAVVDNGLNITAAAEAVFTLQPGISKQVKLLEDELALQLFVRKGKSLAKLTEAGEEVVTRARKILNEVDNIKSLSQQMAGASKGELIVATTHTQARYVLPDLIEDFHREYPDLSISLHQGTSDRIARQVSEQQADFAIASGHSGLFEDLVTFPIYSWERSILVQPEHPLARMDKIAIEDLARYPIISYTHSFDEDSDLANAFKAAGIEAKVVFTAEDPDVIKTYVRKGMGVGVIACMAYDPERDADLVAIRVPHLFPLCTTWIGFRRDRFLRDYMHAFIEMMVPDIDRDCICEAVQSSISGTAKVVRLVQTALPDEPEESGVLLSHSGA